MARKKKADYTQEQARKMPLKKLIQEIKKGKTVSGYNDMEEETGKTFIKDKPVKEIERELTRKGSFYHEGTVKDSARGSIVGSARELFGNGRAAPPAGRKSWW